MEKLFSWETLWEFIYGRFQWGLDNSFLTTEQLKNKLSLLQAQIVCCSKWDPRKQGHDGFCTALHSKVRSKNQHKNSQSFRSFYLYTPELQESCNICRATPLLLLGEHPAQQKSSQDILKKANAGEMKLAG